MPDTVKDGADQRGAVRVASAISILAVVVLAVVFGLLYQDTMAATDLATVQMAFSRAVIIVVVALCSLIAVAWLISRVMPTRNRLVMFDGLTTGVAEVGHVEVELSKSQVRFQALIENTADVTILFGPDEVYRYVSPSITRISGLSAEEIIGHSLREFVHPVDQKMFVDTLNNALRNPGESLVLPEYRVLLPGGRTIFYEGLMTGLPAGAGVEGVVLNGRELTERQAAAKALEESETKYRAITENTSDITTITSVDGDYKYVSPSISRNIGYSEEQIFEKRFYNFIYEDDRPLIESAIQKAVENPGETFFYPQIRVNHANGHLVYYDLQFTDMLEVPGVEGIVASGRDVTERVLGEKDIRDANLKTQALQRRLNDALESFDDGFMLFDSDERLIMCNSALEKEFRSVANYLKPGTSYGDFQRAVFKDSSDILTGNFSTEDALARRLSHHNDPGLEPWVAETSDGRWIMVNEYRTHDGGFALVRSDVTGRIEAEQRAVAAKDEAESASQAKSEFLSSMSHELRTPMNAIMGFTQLLDFESTNLTESQKGYVAEIMKAGGHLMDLIVDVLNLSRIEVGEMDVELTDLAVREIVDECLPMARVTAAERDITLVDRSADRALPTVRADSVRLKQVLLNILSNAVKYNAEGGEILFDCEQTSGNTLRFRVTDTGPGIPEDMFDRLFEPFDRLGAENSSVLGTGVGLTITKRIVDLMNGEIRVDSEVGKGSTFWIELPIGASTCKAETTGLKKEAVAKP
jgi:PAS domain S-box-containing protein